jgi:hypothetical protein
MSDITSTSTKSTTEVPAATPAQPATATIAPPNPSQAIPMTEVEKLIESALEKHQKTIEKQVDLEGKIQFIDGRVRGLTDSQRSMVTLAQGMNTLAQKWIWAVCAVAVGLGVLQYLKSRDLEETTKRAIAAELSKTIKTEVEQKFTDFTNPLVGHLNAENLNTAAHVDIIKGDFINAAARLALAGSQFLRVGDLGNAENSMRTIIAVLPKVSADQLKTPAIAFPALPLGQHLTNIMELAIAKDLARFTNSVVEMKRALQAVYDTK